MYTLSAGTENENKTATNRAGIVLQNELFKPADQTIIETHQYFVDRRGLSVSDF